MKFISNVSRKETKFFIIAIITNVDQCQKNNNVPAT